MFNRVKIIGLMVVSGAVLAACGPEVPEVTQAEAAEVIAAVQANRDLEAIAAPEGGWPADTAYAINFDGLMGGEVPMSAFQDKAVLVVNTASKCGYTPQYEGLQALYEARKDEGLVVVGVPSGDFMGQEFSSDEDIAKFCTLNFGVTFPMTSKFSVKGDDAHAFYQWAEGQLGEDAVPQWNFHKVLIGRDGKAQAAFASGVEPGGDELAAAIDAALAS